MDHRKAGRAFLYSVITTIVLMLGLGCYYLLFPRAFPSYVTMLFNEAAVLLPVLAVAFFHEGRLGMLIPFRRVRLKTLLLAVVYVILLFPITMFIDTVSGVFLDKTASVVTDKTLLVPIWIMIPACGVIAPLVEESVFRGVMLHSYKRSGNVAAAMVISSLMFGIIHLRFSQLAYAAIMGLMLALLVEATGSVATSVFAHGLFNILQMLWIYYGPAEDPVTKALAALFHQKGLMTGMIIYLVPALVCAVLGIYLAYRMAGAEKREQEFAAVFSLKGRGYRLVTYSLLLGTVISLVYMAEISI